MSRSLRPIHLRLVEGSGAPAATPDASRATHLDDSELLAAVRAGDDWAASTFCRRVRPRIVTTIERLLGCQDDDLNDLVQVSLIEMVQTIDRFRGECSLDTWTSTVTAHAVFKHIRRRRLERRIFERGAESPADEPAAPVEVGARVVALDLLRRVRNHLARMDADRTWAFLLHDVCGFDLREAARIMGVSVAAAQKRLVRGRHELRARLADDPELADRLARTEGKRNDTPG
jgi:RNA polymerase sigma-70 factor, ECF subfamily